MVSDDTEHTAFVAQALIAHPDSVEEFQRALAWKLRWWLLCVPAGIGFATLRAILKLWFGAPATRSGIRSAGNGPAMRSAILGAYFSEDKAKLEVYLTASTRLTHTDDRALNGAYAIAICARSAIKQSGDTAISPALVLDELRSIGEGADTEWTRLIQEIESGLKQNLAVKQFAESIGLSNGVTGYMYHTVPVVLYAWLHHYGDFEATISAIINCGGDTDTTAAIAGALAGATVGVEGIPIDWIEDLIDWPCSPKRLLRIAQRLAETHTSRLSGVPISTFWPAILLRNLFFAMLVIAHGFRRLLPPY